MQIIDELIAQVTPRAKGARPVDIRIGCRWTGVVLETNVGIRSGLSSTLGGTDHDHHYGGHAPVSGAGHLLESSVLDLVALANSTSLEEASVGLATLNALLDVDEAACAQVNAAEVIAERGAGKRVAIIGHFPFTPQIRACARELWVLELAPREGDLPSSKIPDILPQADVLALTATVLLNHTFESVMQSCKPEAFVIMLGATTPLSPLLFSYGLDALAGTVLMDPENAMLAISQGATYRQIPGRRLLTLFRPGVSVS